MIRGQRDKLDFIQSSTRMCLERAFEILKGRWSLIMKRNKVPLRNMPNILTACIVLYNLYIVNNEGIEEE